MKAFGRIVSGLLAIFMLCTFTMWRQNTLPDLSGVTALMHGVTDKIDSAASAIQGAVSLVPTRPVDQSAGSGENVYVEYDLSEPVDETLEETICTGLEAMQATIDVSAYHLSQDDLKAVMAQIIYSHPELFYVSSSYKISYSESTGTAIGLVPEYLYAPAAVEEMKETYQNSIDKIVAEVELEWSDFDKALYLHDYFIKNYTYDHSYTIRDAYTFFAEKTGVCQAYMLAFIAAGSAVGLEVLPVTSNEMLHAWNLVKIEDSWYHVDITWDDSSANPAEVSYRYFLQSDTGLARIDAEEDNPHRKWNAVASADNETYDNATYREARAAIVKHADTYYCVLSVENGEKYVHGAIYAGTDVTALTPQHYIKAEWSAGANSYYKGCYSGICYYNGMLLYNTATSLRAYRIADGTELNLGILSVGSGSIYGLLGISGNLVTLVVADSPNMENIKEMLVPLS